MINPDSATPTPNPLTLIGPDEPITSPCSPSAVTLTAPVNSGSLTQASEISIQLANGVQVASGAVVTRAPASQ